MLGFSTCFNFIFLRADEFFCGTLFYFNCVNAVRRKCVCIYIICMIFENKVFDFILFFSSLEGLRVSRVWTTTKKNMFFFCLWTNPGAESFWGLFVLTVETVTICSIKNRIHVSFLSLLFSFCILSINGLFCHLLPLTSWHYLYRSIAKNISQFSSTQWPLEGSLVLTPCRHSELRCHGFESIPFLIALCYLL